MTANVMSQVVTVVNAVSVFIVIIIVIMQSFNAKTKQLHLSIEGKLGTRKYRIRIRLLAIHSYINNNYLNF